MRFFSPWRALAVAAAAAGLACSSAPPPTVQAEVAEPAPALTDGLSPVNTVVVPAYSGRAVAVDRGQLVRITDIEGKQVGDLFALPRADTFNYLCTFRSRTTNRKLFPAPGEQFVTLTREPILTFLTDRSPGKHDMLYATCDRNTYKNRGAGDDHPNCNDNFLQAVKAVGIDHFRWAPGPVNIFQNTPVAEDGITLAGGVTLSEPGDFLEFRAEQDIWLVLTACSYDIGDFIGGRSKPLRIEVFESQGSAD